MSLVEMTGPGSKPKTGAARPAPTENLFLAGLDEADRQAVVQASSPLRLLAGEPLWEAGEVVEEAFFPTRGALAEMVGHPSGKTALSRLVGQEGVLGALTGPSGRPAIGPAVALTACEGLHIDAQTFAQLRRERSSLREAVDAQLAWVVEEVSLTAGCAACHKLDRRLPALILAWRHRLPEAQRLDATHDQLCELLGAQRTTVTSLMRALKADGLLRSGRGWLKVLDEEGLSRRSCGCHLRTAVPRGLSPS